MRVSIRVYLVERVGEKTKVKTTLHRKRKGVSTKQRLIAKDKCKKRVKMNGFEVLERKEGRKRRKIPENLFVLCHGEKDHTPQLENTRSVRLQHHRSIFNFLPPSKRISCSRCKHAFTRSLVRNRWRTMDDGRWTMDHIRSTRLRY